MDIYFGLGIMTVSLGKYKEKNKYLNKIIKIEP